MAETSPTAIERERPSLCFEDVVVGQRHRSGTRVVVEDDIIAFARQWDPQPFHLDHAAAMGSLFGTLVASGLQTLLISFNLYNDIGLFRTTALAGAGMERVYWLAPVYPGDQLQVGVEFAAKRPVRAANRGLVTVRLTTLDGPGRQVLTLELLVLVARRVAGAPGAAD